MSLTVGAVARLAGVTVRTLHHYDEIGLLSASDRSDAGYRRYADGTSSGFSGSSSIESSDSGSSRSGDVMTYGDADAVGHLRRQHAIAPGLAQYLHDAIKANAATHCG